MFYSMGSCVEVPVYACTRPSKGYNLLVCMQLAELQLNLEQSSIYYGACTVKNRVLICCLGIAPLSATVVSMVTLFKCTIITQVLITLTRQCSKLKTRSLAISNPIALHVELDHYNLFKLLKHTQSNEEKPLQTLARF